MRPAGETRLQKHVPGGGRRRGWSWTRRQWGRAGGAASPSSTSSQPPLSPLSCLMDGSRSGLDGGDRGRSARRRLGPPASWRRGGRRGTWEEQEQEHGGSDGRRGQRGGVGGIRRAGSANKNGARTARDLAARRMAGVAGGVGSGAWRVAVVGAAKEEAGEASARGEREKNHAPLASASLAQPLLVLLRPASRRRRPWCTGQGGHRRWWMGPGRPTLIHDPMRVFSPFLVPDVRLSEMVRDTCKYCSTEA